ncbi:MAG: ATP-binding cassette domain-containing protein, partial [Bauldia sp.]|nr:ATP-binding cassette domain-containing protein [Bauldia sp.]
MSEVELKGVKKRYGSVEAIKSLDLSVERGEFCALLGPSGCGKSTLLRMIAGLEVVTEGTILIGGVDVTNVPPMR